MYKNKNIKFKIALLFLLFLSACKKELPKPGEAFISPTAETQWKEGELQDIKWESQAWDEIQIILIVLKKEKEHHEIKKYISNSTEDDGLFEKWTIPELWGFSNEDSYEICYIKIQKKYKSEKNFVSTNFIIYNK